MDKKALAAKADQRDIICPYCFGSFKDTQVVFRSNHVSAASKVSSANSLFGGTVSSSINEDSTDALYRPYEGPYKANAAKADTKLEDFWLNRGREAGFIRHDPRWSYPHIDPASSTFSDMIVISPENGRTDEKGFVRDKDGFVTRVIEKTGDNDMEMTRLCPHCHNPLPFTEYGKYDVKFISIVGIRASGKTVFLNQLLTKFPSVIAHTGYHVAASTLSESVKLEKVEPGFPLPASTDDKVMRRPSAINMVDDKGNGRTIVFYDIAGENCVPKDAAASIEALATNRESTVARFLAFCDGLLFLIDPEQVPIYAVKAQNGVSDIQKVIDVVNKIRPAHNNMHPSWNDIPVAAVLTKSDTLDASLSGIEPLIFSNVNYKNAAGKSINGFNRSEFMKINSSLSKEFESKVQTITDSLRAFAQKGYFAVSAITCGVENHVELHQNQYILSESDSRKFRMLREWAIGWDARQPENRQYYMQCPARDEYGAPIPFDYSEDSTSPAKQNIRTDIQATTSFGDGSTSTINLTFGEIMELNQVGYPAGEPNPRRVEEPFLWILWKLKILGPFFARECPREKKFLESQSKYQDYCDAFNAEMNEKEKRFYECKDQAAEQA